MLCISYVNYSGQGEKRDIGEKEHEGQLRELTGSRKELYLSQV